MNTQKQDGDLTRVWNASVTTITASLAAALLSCPVLAGEPAPRQEPDTHMSKVHRDAISKVVVLPTTIPTRQGTMGTHEKQTTDMLDGIAQGGRIGTITRDVGPVQVGYEIRVLKWAGMLFGGVSGKVRREIQDFRDALTNDLSNSVNPPLTNDALASDVFWRLRNVPSLDSKVFALTTPIPADTDAILYVSLTDVTVNVQGKEAIITTSASATLQRVSDGEHLYENLINYSDRDTLGNWTANDNALWRDYSNFARHYIGREISAEAFERIELPRTLVPMDTETVSRIKKNKWQGKSRSLSPTLAWELALLGGGSYDEWAKDIGDADISYDIEVYDSQRLVYAAKGLSDTQHTVANGLKPCKTYRWSVRPGFSVGTEKRFGEWMRLDSQAKAGNGNVGRKISDAPAYTQDFASLNIHCKSR